MVSLVRVLEAKDPCTQGHSERVSETTQILAEHMWGAIPKASELALAGRLHDIGEVAIRTEVLNKPGHLEDDEWAHVRTHPVVGQRILSPVVRLSGVIDAVRHTESTSMILLLTLHGTHGTKCGMRALPLCASRVGSIMWSAATSEKLVGRPQRRLH